MSNIVTVNMFVDKELDMSYDVEIIIHISDIHIKSSDDRETEYLTVFGRFYDFLKEKDNSKVLTVITGDLLDDETTPYAITQLKNFIINICKYSRCLIIKGNHEIMLNRDIYELNKLTSVLFSLNTDKPMYLLDNDGNYHFKNVTFTYTSLYSTEVTECKPKKNNIAIGLYHGTVKEVFDMENKYTNSGRFQMEDFNNYDYILLGDIHKRQKIGKNGYYAGSLIQQNVKEDINKGGYIINLKTNKVDEFDIINDYAQIAVTVDKDGTMDIDVNKLPKNVKVKFINKSLDDMAIERCKDEFSKCDINIYNSKIVHNLQETIDTEFKIGNDTYDLSKINDRKTICALAEKCLKMNGLDDNNQIKKIIELLCDVIDNELCGINIDNDNFQRKTVKLKTLYFSNIGCYGEDNHIDFECMNIHKIIGLCAQNNMGKSTILDIIAIALSGRSPKGCKKVEILNSNEKNGYIKLIINVNDDIYCIMRTYERKTKKQLSEIVTISKFNNKNDKSNYNDMNSYSVICDDIVNETEQEKNNDINEENENKGDNDGTSLYENDENKSKNKSASVSKSNIFIEKNICALKDLLSTSIINQKRDGAISDNKPSDILSILLK